MRTAAQSLDEYGVSHRDPTNKRLHWICVPVIVWSVIGLLWSLPVPSALSDFSGWLNWATLTVFAAIIYYAILSLSLALGAALALTLMVASIELLASSAWAPLWAVSAVLFVLAWIGQFVGHHIEGQRPSFFKDLEFLLIGPLWLVAGLYRMLGIRY